jgi:plasmid maintenance system antidote protein VapI
MNIIEAEDLVKGLPDQALFQEAQFPSGRIPQFLAVSEVQRRQDMRQRFQAAQQEQQATVKDQILQGGIGSTGMAPEMTSAPPMAPQMPPQGAPMPPPVGMAMGGIVPYRMQEGRTVPGSPLRSEIQRILNKPPYLRTSEEDAILNSANLPFQGARQLASALRDSSRDDKNLVPYDLSQRSVPSSRGEFSPATVTSNLDRSASPNMAFSRVLFGSGSSPTEAPIVNNGSAATAPVNARADAQTSGVTDRAGPTGGIVDVGAAMNAQRNAPRQQAGAGTDPMGYFANLLKPYERPTEVQAAIDLQRQQMEQGLPPPIDLNQYIQSAQQRQQEARDEARQMAIANTLMNLGTGLFAGDPAAGLQRATQAATETLREGRREAQAEGRMAEQLQLQAAQQNRQNLLDNMKFRSESVNAIANIISGEEKITRETQMQAAQVLSNYQINLLKMQNDLTVAGMGRKDIERKLESEARNRATELVLESIKGRVQDPSNPVDAQDLARQVDTITRQLLGGMDSAPQSAGSVTVRHQNKDYIFPTQEAADEFISRAKRLGI